MSSPILPSLQIARLLLRKGDLHESRLAAEDARFDALILEDRRQWLEATRLFFQCCQELEEAAVAQKYMDEVLSFLVSAPPSELQAQAETLVSSWLLATGKKEEAVGYVQSAIEKSMQARDLETLARALSILALSFSLDTDDYSKALTELDKLDAILASVEITETQLTSYLMRAFIYTQTSRFDLSLPLLWKTYDLAKSHGFHFHISTVMAQIARAHRDQGQDDEYQLYAELALRGLSHTKSPRLYRLIQHYCPAAKTEKNAFDFQIDERARRVREKTKGSIDFKNQHILFEMALLFIKHPGTKYNKDDLAKIIWSQVYSPDLHDNLIYVSIKRLRTLLEPDIESPRYILRDRKGYYFNPQSVVQFKNPEEATL